MSFPKAYTNKKRLSQSDYKIFYKAQEKESGKWFSIKNLTIEQNKENIFAQLKEIKYPSILSFKMIPQEMDDDDTNDKCFWLISDYFENGSLFDIFQKKNISPCQRYIILLGIAKGMEYMHSKNIIHHNLHPGNVLIDKDLYPHISDFSQYKTKNLFQQGSDFIPYTDPDILNSILRNEIEHFVYTKYNDIYSFSMIAYLLFTWEKPYASDNYNRKLAIEILQNGKRPDLSIIEEDDIKIFFENLWSSDPKKRPLFESITKRIQESTFMKAMKVNSIKLENYLKQFPVALPQLNPNQSQKYIKTSSSVSFSTNPNETQSERNKKLQISASKAKVTKPWQISSRNLRSPTNSSRKSFESSGSFNSKQTNIINHSRSYDDYSDLELLMKADTFYKENDKKQASQFYKRSADKGNVTAMNNYATMLWEGDGINVDIKIADEYYQKAIAKNFAISMNNCANMLYKKDQKRSIDLYKKAAEYGMNKAMKCLGYIYYTGIGVRTDKDDAAYYYKLAADSGDDVSMCLYAHMLRHGDGIDYDKATAAEYYKKAADKGNCQGMKCYAQMLLNGEGVLVDAEKACSYFKKAADLNNISAMKGYADMVRYGKGVERKPKEAAKYYEKAAYKNDLVAMNNYAFMLLNGEGIRKDPEIASKWFKKAADKGNISSMKNYAHMLYKGEGIEIDKKEAAKYYKMAADKGDEKAIKIYLKIVKNDNIFENENEEVDVKLTESIRYENMLYEKEDWSD